MNFDNFRSHALKEKKILKGTFFIVSTGILSSVFSTITNIVFSRFFGPSGFGLYKTSLGLAGTAAYLIDFGMKYLLPKYIPELEDNKNRQTINLIKPAVFLKIGITLLFLIIFFIFRQEISRIFFDSRENLSLITLTAILFSVISLDLTLPVLFGFQNFKLVAVTSLLVPILHIVFGLSLIFKYGVNGAIFAAILAFIFAALPAIIFIIKKLGKEPKVNNFKFKNAFLSYGLPAYFINFPTYITIFIIPLLSVFFTQKQVGFYGLSLSFYTAAQMVPVTLGNAMFPKVAKLYSQSKEKEAFATFKSLLLIYTPFVVLGALLALPLIKPLLSLLIPSFLPAHKIITIQIVAAFLFGYLAMASNYVTAIGKLKSATLINWFLSSLFLILAFFLTGLTE